MKNARRTFGVAGLVVVIAAAVAWYRLAPGEAPVGPSASAERKARELVFLTRGDCASTTVMRRNLDEALKSFGLAAGYEVVDQDILAESDVRHGYPTPTLLYQDRDVFGMSAPKPPLPDPT